MPTPKLPHLAVIGAFCLFLTAASATAADKMPTDWDGLVKVPTQKFDGAWIAPGADFSAYTKVMLDPTEAAFRKDWQRDFNRSTSSLDGRITDDEARKILEAVQSGLQDVFTEEYQRAGYQVVTSPAPDVLRLRTGIANLDVVAPDQFTSGRSYTFSSEAGHATLILEARDSMSGAILGRGVDSRTLDDVYLRRRTSVSNRSDFMNEFRTWAKMSVNAMAKLKAMPAPAVASH